MSERLARRLYALLVFAALPLAALTLTNKADPDLWMHIRAGRVMVETHDVPRSDPFSFAIEGKPWVDHEWLFQLLAFGMFSLAGSAGLMLAKGAIGAGTMVCLYGATAERAESLPVRAFVFLASSAVVVCLGLTCRPQIATLLGCALIVLILERSRRGGRALDYAPWLIVPWSWFHGGFVAGALLFALIALGEAVNGRPRGKLLANLLLALGATALNPYGFELWGKVYEMVSGSVLSRYILEWRPFWASGVGLYRGIILFFGALLAVAFVGDDDRKENTSEWLLAAAGLAASVMSVRHLLLLAILSVPALAIGFEKLRRRSTPSTPSPVVVNAFGAAILALFAGLAFCISYEVPVHEGVPLGALVYGEKEPGWLVYPKGAVDFLNAHGFAGRVWSDASVGGYLVWHLSPGSRIFLDGRTDLYPVDVLTDYAAAMAAAPDWESIIDRRAPGLLLLPASVPLAEAAQASGRWRAVYRDPDYVAFVAGARAEPALSPRPALPWLFP